MEREYIIPVLVLSILIGGLSSGLITSIVVDIDPYLRLYAIGIAFAIGFLITAGVSAVFVKVLKI